MTGDLAHTAGKEAAGTTRQGGWRTLACPRVADRGGSVSDLGCYRTVSSESSLDTRACHDGPVNRGLARILVVALGLVSPAACSSTAPSSPTLSPTSPRPSPPGFYSLIGPPPTNCPVAPPLAIVDAFGPALGTSPAWALGFMAESGRDVLHIIDSLHGRTGPHGLYRKVLWLTQPGYAQRVTLSGRSLSHSHPPMVSIRKRRPHHHARPRSGASRRARFRRPERQPAEPVRELPLLSVHSQRRLLRPGGALA
jgi:hypothetical protein